MRNTNNMGKDKGALLSACTVKLVAHLARFLFERSGRPKRTGSGQFEWKGQV